MNKKNKKYVVRLASMERRELELMVKKGKTSVELIDYLYSKVGPHYYQRFDMEYPASKHQSIVTRLQRNQPRTIDGVKVASFDTLDGFRFTLADSSWLLIRFSGTEPIIRVYAETDSPARAGRLLGVGKELAGL